MVKNINHILLFYKKLLLLKMLVKLGLILVKIYNLELKHQKIEILVNLIY